MAHQHSHHIIAVDHHDTSKATHISPNLNTTNSAFTGAHIAALNNVGHNQYNITCANQVRAARSDQFLSYLNPVEMNECNRTDCLPNTRLDVIRSIVDWIADESSKRKCVLWLYGLAGSGKSTLSTTIAWRMRDLQRLGAFFFFDRDIPERNAATLIRTLAYQLALYDVRFGDAISQIVESIPRIAEMPLGFQITNLLSAKAMESVQWTGGPIVLIIDGLDECGSPMERKILLQTLSKGFLYLPSFMRVVVVSRQEIDIEDTFASHPSVQLCPLRIDSATNQEDISAFLRHRFSEIRKTARLGLDWPANHNISALTKIAAGLFVWASTACLYIDSYDPDQRLNEIITQQPGIDSSEPFAQLDKLYKTGLQSAGLWDSHSFRTDCCNIFGAILCGRIPLSYSMIDSLLELPPTRSSLQSISRLGCVLRWGETEGIRILHPSFRDYLSVRSSEEPWAINLELHNRKLALHCIELLDNTLRENICGLTLPHPVESQALPQALSYACRFWVEHIGLISHAGDYILDRIYQFLGRHLLHWMEALAILKCHDRTIRSLQNLLDWLRKSSPDGTDLHQLVYDGHRFAQYFANTIKEHPLLVYTTALPFTPANTSLYKKFYQNELLKVVCGVEKIWSRGLQQLRGHNGCVFSVAFTPDGSRIASGSLDKTIRVWDASTSMEMLPPLQGHGGWIRSVGFSPDGSKIVSGSDDWTIRVWDASTGIELIPSLRGHDSYVHSTAFSLDGSKIVSGSRDKTIRVWDASTGVEMLPPLRGHHGSVNSVAFSPSSSKIVSGSHDKTIRVWDAGTGVEMLPPLRGHHGSVNSVVFSPDSSKIISGSDDRTIRVWDASTGVEMLPPLLGHDLGVTSVAFSPDGFKIISGSNDETIRVWDATTGVKMLPPLRGHNSNVCSVAVSPDGSTIVSGSYDQTIRVWDASVGLEMIQPLRGHDGWIRSVAFSPNGTKIVSGSRDKTIQVWDASTGVEILPPLRGHHGSVNSVAFSPDSSKIVSGSDDRTIRVWDASTGLEMLQPLRGHDDWLRSVAFSPNGTKIVSGSRDKSIRVWDASTGVAMLPPLRGHGGSVNSVAFSPDSSRIVSGSDDSTIRVWDASTGIGMLPPLRGHDDRVYSVEFSPDGSKITSRTDDGIRIWDASAGVQLLPALTAQNGYDDVSWATQNCSIVSLDHEWFTDSNTGHCLGRLPVGGGYYCWEVHMFTCVGWTADHKLVILQFPIE